MNESIYAREQKLRGRANFKVKVVQEKVSYVLIRGMRCHYSNMNFHD